MRQMPNTPKSSRSSKMKRLTTALGLVLSALITVSSGAGASGLVFSPLVNPSANIASNPDVLQSGNCTGGAGNWTCTNPCVGPNLTWIPGGNTPACSAYTMRAINNARSQLGENPLTLPSNWNSLSYAQQLFVIADMERVSAGYAPYLGINATLSQEAQTAAAKNQDPALASGFAVGTNSFGHTGFDGSWAGTDNVLFADYMWMYDDGWGGSPTSTSNILCTGPGVWACWDHRDNLLGSSTDPTQGVGLDCTTCEMGTALAEVSGTGSLVDLIEKPAGSPPAMTFTWASELSFFSAGDNPPQSAPMGPAPVSTPAKLTLSKIVFALGGAKFSWSENSTPANLVTALIYSASSCRFGSVAFRIATTGVSQGLLYIPGRLFSRRGTYYSVRLVVGNSTGLLKSNCINLGRP